MTLCRRGRSVLRRTLVRGLVVTSVIGANLPTTAQLNSASFSHVRNVARNWRRTAAHDLALTQACPIQCVQGSFSAQNGLAASNARLARRTRASAPIAPTICSPIGSPSRRSEEHTSELQSLRHLVCRLLL